MATTPDNVHMFTGVTPYDMPAQVMLDGAKRADLKSVIIIGIDQDEQLFFSSSIADGGDVLWWMEKVRFALMSRDALATEEFMSTPSSDAPTCSPDLPAGADLSSTPNAKVLSFTTKRTDAPEGV